VTSPSTGDDPGSSIDAVLRSLGDELDGSVCLPGDADWDLVRQAWNLAADQRPCAVVFAETADVSAVVRMAAAHGCRVAPQGTGHGAACLRTGDDVILLRTSRMTGVDLDPGALTARVRCGATSPHRRPSTASLRLPVQPVTSASSATPSAVASAGWPGAMGSPPTACWPPRS
jgi:FAD/FMN-containing dehydrogenase